MSYLVINGTGTRRVDAEADAISIVDDLHSRGFSDAFYAAYPGTDVMAYLDVDPVAKTVSLNTAAQLADARSEKTQAINAERDKRLFPGRVNATIADGSTIPADLRNEGDVRNLDTIYSRAQRLSASGITDPVMPFRDADDVEHTLTPADQIAICEAALDHGTAVYRASWTHKDSIDALTTVAEVDAYDITTGWTA